MKRFMVWGSVILMATMISGCSGSQDEAIEAAEDQNIQIQEQEHEQKVKEREHEQKDFQLDFQNWPEEAKKDLQKLPPNIQSYIKDSSIHVKQPFISDPKAREILIKAAKLIPDFNSNDVDELIADTGRDTSYGERLQILLNRSQN